KIFAKILSHHLSLNPDFQVEEFHTGKEFLNNLYKKPDMISLDYNLPGLSGMEIVEKVKAYDSKLPIVIVSGQQDISTAVELFKKGVYDYIVKDDDSKERLWNISAKIKEKHDLEERIDDLEAEVDKKYEFGNLIKGSSQEIQQIFRLMQKAVKANISVTVHGETGTGKELVAKSIHFNSSRKKHKFVPVNVSAIPSELIESEFFGHEKGAFTGAVSSRIGKFEEAHKGTLFLDEIGDMDPAMQAKLLRVLQEGQFSRIGSNKTVSVDVRVISATHKNLEEEVKKETFREDLFYRLQGLPIKIPPLRQRKEDIVILAKSFLTEFCKKNSLPGLKLSRGAIKKLQEYNYPGNVRELKAITDLAAVMATTDEITEEDIMFSGQSSIDNLLKEEMTMDEYQQLIIKHFLEKYDNKVRLVADKLDLGKTTIYRMMKEGKL
ncbi:MAG TPA: sigma-54 dependent transcriptional regulator, partial [Bacteroidales bacterium]|nr:sigma-54 dependent transcriptional regulator [Bacteroidales bacterium]